MSQMRSVTSVSRATIIRGIRKLKSRKLEQITKLLRRSAPDVKAQSSEAQEKIRYRVRRPGGGRKRVEDKYPQITSDIERLLANEIAGDPMSSQRWVRSSSRNLSLKLAELGYSVSDNTVLRLLKGMGFSQKSNQRRQIKRVSPERDEQFKYIAT